MSAKRYRSTIACHSCRSRKVRCSINATGIPCIRCAQDHAECVVGPPDEATRASRRSGLIRQRMRVTTNSPRTRPDQPEYCTPISSRHVTHSPAPPAAEGQDDIQNEERNGLEIAAAALGTSERAGNVPFYTGYKTGPVSTLSLVATGGSLPQHLLIPSSVSTPLCEEDRAYLASKGVFNLPSHEACECLLQAYFRHVHTIVPVIEADKILEFFHAGRLHEYKLLLVWSVFFVAVNFVPSSICEREGYTSRKAMKAAMYTHAKCLYNNSGERDKIVLLQASILLGFWHSEVDEHGQPWYWSGVAISLGQILGLYRDPDAARYNAAITVRQRQLWRRLWWTCFLRDRWLSLTLGRPLRIDVGDCDVPMPSVADMLYDFQDVPVLASAGFIPDDLPLLAGYWVRLIDLTRLLGSVLSINCKARNPMASSEQIDVLEAEIVGSKPDYDDCAASPGARFYLHHLQLHYEALVITLYRPYLTDISDDLPASQIQWRRSIWHKADAAASQTNDILESLARENILDHALPMTPPLLIPAMQVHLLHCRTGNALSKRLRLNKLNACMMVMEEFQKVYIVASIYRAIFAKAIQMLCPETLPGTRNENQGPSSAGEASTVPGGQQPVLEQHVSPASGQVPAPGPDLTDMVDALMDESLPFHFWEAWNDIDGFGLVYPDA
ncbi:fungal-specific transcription factor domain-containing protein [Aspergillus carlsbadensis]|nr:fungal-specific transcription factor domain-containing protein [Aspergillus carlsbadensis]